MTPDEDLAPARRADDSHADAAVSMWLSRPEHSREVDGGRTRRADIPAKPLKKHGGKEDGGTTARLWLNGPEIE